MRVYGLDADRRGANTLPINADARWRLWGGNVSISRASYERIGGYSWPALPRLRLGGCRLRLPTAAGGDFRSCSPRVPSLHHVASTTTAIRARRAFDSRAARWTCFDTSTARAQAGLQSPRLSLRGTVRLSACPGGSRAAVAASSRDVEQFVCVLPSAIARRTVGMIVEASSVAGIGAHEVPTM